ncbi:MAG: type II toxin-antitoxin system RelE/ParE family toxin [Isosphaeraceae bacterium]
MTGSRSTDRPWPPVDRSDGESRVMMLHAFVKKSEKTPTKELKIAHDRMKEVQADADA